MNTLEMIKKTVRTSSDEAIISDVDNEIRNNIEMVQRYDTYGKSYLSVFKNADTISVLKIFIEMQLGEMPHSLVSQS
ncbi:hypothetical protein H8356DRAFT_1353203 [Neocallimastix lanati (nom. inval.)]|nr:hypothetical protein H8356DRAFT_1353203 [Neocallimastix sp. JGI-2020a]